MSTIDDILRQVPIDSIASRLGVDPSTADKAVRAALPRLVSGAEDDTHGRPTSALGGLAGLSGLFGRDRVDVDEAERQSDDAAQGVDQSDADEAARDAEKAGLDGDKSRTLIKILIPIVVGYLLFRNHRKHAEANLESRRGNHPEGTDMENAPRDPFREGSILDKARDALIGDPDDRAADKAARGEERGGGLFGRK